MEFLDLPTELRLPILEYLDPDGAFNLAVTSKAQWEFCRPTIQEHGRRFAQARVINGEGIGSNDLRQGEDWELLMDVLDDPRAGWYFRDLIIRNDFSDYNWRDENCELGRERTEAYASAVRYIKTLYKPAESRSKLSRWDRCDNLLQEMVETEDKTWVITTLVHFLPKLRVLRFTDSEKFYDLFALVERVAHSHRNLDNVTTATLPFRHIATVAKNHLTGDPGCDPLWCRYFICLPFQNLTTVAMTHVTGHPGCDPLWCRYFICLPSLRNFISDTMGPESASGDMIPLPAGPRGSNVEELLFNACMFADGVLEEILGDIKHLKRFSYSGSIDKEYCMQPKRVIRSLLDHSGHCLEQLVLDHEDLGSELGYNDDLCYAPLYDFHSLKSLKIDWRMIWPNLSTYDEDPELVWDSVLPLTNFDLWGALPLSLEALHITGPFDDRQWGQMKSVMDTDRSRVPNLQKICFERTGHEGIPGNGGNDGSNPGNPGSARIDDDLISRGDDPMIPPSPLMNYLEGL